MEKTFLYIDILGFKNLVTSNTDKVESIFKIIDSLHVHKDIAFQTIVFSDTILVFNKDNSYKTFSEYKSSSSNTSYNNIYIKWT